MGRAEREGVPRPLPLGLPLLAVMLLVLLGDRAFGLVSLTVFPGAGFVGGLPPSGAAALLADVVAAGTIIAVLAGVELSGRPRTRGATLTLLIVAALIGLQLGALAAEAATGVPLTSDVYLARALLLAGTTMAAVLVLAALAEHRAAVGALRSATAAAESLAESGRVALRDLREDVAVRVREILRDALTALEAGASSGSGARLRSLADEVLRPLSHRLAAMPQPSTPVTRVIVTPRWRDTLMTLMRTPIVPPRTLALLAAGLAFLRTLVTDQDAVRGLAPAIPADTEGVGIALSVEVGPVLIVIGELVMILVVAWWGASRLASRLQPQRGALRPALAWMLASLGLGGIASLTVIGPFLVDRAAGVGTSTFTGPVAFVASLVPLLAVTLGTSLVSAVGEGRAGLEVALAREQAEAARAAARVQAVLGHERRRLAQSLHADVQATVNAAGLLLDRAAREGVATQEFVGEVAERIALSVERFLVESSAAHSITERLKEVRDLWMGVCTVSLHLSDAAVDRSDADTVTRGLIVDLVTEACANAVVHGGAGDIRISVILDGGEIVLEVVDDGTQRREQGGGYDGVVAGATAGLGTQILRASCTSFTLELEDHGGRLHARIPLG